MSATTGEKSGASRETPAATIVRRLWSRSSFRGTSDAGRHEPRRPTERRGVWAPILVCFIVLLLTAAALGRALPEDEGLESLKQHSGPGPIEQILEFWQQWRGVFIWGAACLLLVAAVWIIKPFRFLDAASDRMLKRSLRGVEDLLKRIQEEAEAASENSKKEESTVVEEGLLAGLAEVAEFSNAEQVPPYVLTVNDLMLDNIRLTLKRLRRFTEGNAQRYRDYMYSVLKGMKTLTEQSAEGGVSSGLAVDIREYFADDKRYQAWQKLLSPAAKRGRHQEIAQGFLQFMKDIREGRSGAVPGLRGSSRQAVGSSGAEGVPHLTQPIRASQPQPPDIPQSASEVPAVVNEETLPAVQQAAAEEARAFCSLVQTGPSPDHSHAWQYELVRRQQQVHRRAEAQRLLAVFLNSERKALREITKIRMLPCRTWEHILHLLGVKDAAHLQKRVDDGLLTTQEILVLEKAFLQTFAKRESLARIYGQGKDAGLMMDLHVPQIRRETLALLRRLQQTEPEPLGDATQALNEEETPQNNQVKRLIEHYVQHHHEPPH